MRRCLACLLLLASLVSAPLEAWTAEPLKYEAVDLLAASEDRSPDSGDRPQLLVGPAAQAGVTPAIVILPGGGYGNLAIDHEGYQIAEWMTSLGIRAAICTYRHRGRGNGGAGYGHPVPMHDAQRAIQLLRARAAEFGIDPARIGVIGFSAGGHLASTVSTRFATGDPNADDPVQRVSSRPDFSILCYPVISLGAAHTHRGSQRNLLGENAEASLVESLSNERQVSDQTPPTFLFHTAEDTAVLPENSTAYALACVRQGVPVELHLFPEGRHGVGLARDVPGASQWPMLCAQWLERQKLIEPSAASQQP